MQFRQTSHKGPMVFSLIAFLLALANAGHHWFPDLGMWKTLRRAENQQAEKTAKLHLSIDQEIARMDAQERLSQRLREYDAPLPHKDLFAVEYIYDPKNPPIVNASRYPPEQHVKVWDDNDFCVGAIVRSQFFFLNDYPGACDWKQEK